MSSCVSGIGVPRGRAAVQLDEIEEPSEHAGLGGDEERLEQAAGGVTDARREQAHEHFVHLGKPAADAVEVLAADRQRLAGLDRRDRRRARRRRVHERELAEGLARAVDRDRHRLSALRHDPRGEAPLDDEMEAVARVAAVEDDLAASERPPPSDRHEPAELRLGQAAEELGVDHG